MDIYKTRAFNKESSKQNLQDELLVEACQEMEKGLIDADLGSGLCKKRIASGNRGKSSGYRLIVGARVGERYFFLHLFPKSEKGNITTKERKALRMLAKNLLDLSESDIRNLLKDGSLLKVRETHEYNP